MSRFANCNYQVLQIRSSYKQRLEQWRSTSLKIGIAKISRTSREVAWLRGEEKDGTEECYHGDGRTDERTSES